MGIAKKIKSLEKFRCAKCNATQTFTRKKMKLKGAVAYRCNKCGWIGILPHNEVWSEEY
jgi:predicted RNA-binding Zn-ribbon protein involved in translation (DUF1610 family)